MERCVITIDKQGSVSFSCKNVWMNEMELVELFDVIAPDTPCRHSSRIQERSVEALRGGKVHQAAQRLLFGSVCPAYDCGTLFPYQHFKCSKCVQHRAGKTVLAKRKASPMGRIE